MKITINKITRKTGQNGNFLSLETDQGFISAFDQLVQDKITTPGVYEGDIQLKGKYKNLISCNGMVSELSTSGQLDESKYVSQLKEFSEIPLAEYVAQYNELAKTVWIKADHVFPLGTTNEQTGERLYDCIIYMAIKREDIIKKVVKPEEETFM